MTYIISINKDGRLNLENISMTPTKKEILKSIIGGKMLVSTLKAHPQAEFFEDFIKECEELNVIEIYSYFYEMCE